jgi:hypothetical protein
MSARRRQILSAGLLAAVTAMFASKSGVAGERLINQTLAADPNGSIEISNLAGRVEVVGWDQAAIAVEGTLSPRVERLDFSSAEDHAQVRVILASSKSNLFFGKGAAQLVIRVPHASSLTLNVGSAELSVKGVIGPLRIESISGPIQLESAAADHANVDIKTMTGNVRFNVDGEPLSAFHIETLTGKIKSCFGPPPIKVAYGMGMRWIFNEGSSVGKIKVVSQSGSVSLCARSIAALTP